MTDATRHGGGGTGDGHAGGTSPSSLAAEPIDGLDQRGLQVLRRTWAAVDPVPPGLVDRVAFAVALDEVWAEVAAIQRLPDARPAGVRSTDRTTQGMTFTASGCTVVVTLTDEGPASVRLDGWITPADVARVTLRLPGGPRITSAPDGRFSFADVPHGMAQLVVAVDGAPGTVTTPTLEV